MKKTLLMLLTALASTAAVAQSTYEELLQHDWARLGSYADQNRALAGQDPEVVFMGNSITWGWVREHPEFFSRNDFTGRGISGQTTAEMLVRFRPDVLDLRPKYVAILAGTNDIAMNNGYISLENICGNIISMCQLAQANGIGVLLCSVAPCARYGWRPEVDGAAMVPQLNALLKAYADATDGVIYVDYFSAMADQHNAMIAAYSEDGCHPNGEGYKVMERIIVRALNELAGEDRQYYLY